MKKWEYLTIIVTSESDVPTIVCCPPRNPEPPPDKHLSELMNELGDEGWELVTVTEGKSASLVFKREKLPAHRGELRMSEELA